MIATQWRCLARWRSLIGATLFLLSCDGGSYAALVGIDFDLSGAPPTNWNRLTATNAAPGTTVTPMTLTNLISEAGAATSVDFRLDSSVHTVRGFNNTLTAASLPTHTQSLANVGGYFHNDATDNDTLTGVFSQLDPSKVYRVWAFVTRTGTAVINTRTTVAGDGTPTTFDSIGNGPSLFINGQLGTSARTLNSYALHVQPVAAGEITITWTEGGAAGNRYTVAGVAIEAIPEPSGMGLALSAVMALRGMRSRRLAAA